MLWPRITLFKTFHNNNTLNEGQSLVRNTYMTGWLFLSTADFDLILTLDSCSSEALCANFIDSKY